MPSAIIAPSKQTAALTANVSCMLVAKATFTESMIPGSRFAAFAGIASGIASTRPEDIRSPRTDPTSGSSELMALSVFELEDGVVYHTYTCYDRGTDVLNGTWQLLDRTPKGRDEGAVEGWPRRKDEY